MCLFLISCKLPFPFLVVWYVVSLTHGMKIFKILVVSHILTYLFSFIVHEYVTTFGRDQRNTHSINRIFHRKGNFLVVLATRQETRAEVLLRTLLAQSSAAIRMLCGHR